MSIIINIVFVNNYKSICWHDKQRQQLLTIWAPSWFIERSMSWKKDTQNNKDLNIAQSNDAITNQKALQLNWNEILHTRNYECMYYVCINVFIKSINKQINSHMWHGHIYTIITLYMYTYNKWYIMIVCLFSTLIIYLWNYWFIFT